MTGIDSPQPNDTSANRCDRDSSIFRLIESEWQLWSNFRMVKCTLLSDWSSRLSDVENPIKLRLHRFVRWMIADREAVPCLRCRQLIKLICNLTQPVRDQVDSQFSLCATIKSRILSFSHPIRCNESSFEAFRKSEKSSVLWRVVWKMFNCNINQLSWGKSNLLYVRPLDIGKNLHSR